MKLPNRRTALVLAIAGVAVLALLFARGAARRRATVATVTVEPVERRNIALTIEATGTVEPIDLVEVKSKASGQIVRMPVQVGSVVRTGDLLAQIDPRDVQSQYDQSLAAQRAAQASLNVAKAQKQRSDQLYREQVITADEHESATLGYANAQSQIVKARTDLDQARQRREDATVRAPISGTVLEQLVSTGQVIASATSSASGGTSLLKMADLSRIRLRALVSETDIGNIRPGQTASVTVDAFPQRTFQGVVEKVEPQAVVQQSVTMFPVLISISNDDRVLLPGMNGEVSMLVQRRDDVPAVPLDAVRSVREVATAAAAVGLNPDSVRAQVQRQAQARAAARGARGGAGADSGAGRGWAGGTGADSTRSRSRFGGAGGDSALAGRRSGRGGAGARAGGGGAGGFAGAGSGGAGGFAGAAGGTGNGGGSGAGTGGGRANRAQFVFVKTDHGFEPRLVRLGLSDFDYAEVVDGLKEGEQVALLGVAEAQAKREQDQARLRQRMGSGTPGAPAIGGAGGGGGAGRGGGGR